MNANARPYEAFKRCNNDVEDYSATSQLASFRHKVSNSIETKLRQFTKWQL